MTDPSSDRFLVSRDGAVALCTLNEPARRNPLTPELVESALAALTALADDDEVRVVVLTGAGPVFSAGADLRPVGPVTKRVGRQQYTRVIELNELLYSYAKPTIAAVNGAAFGAGLALVALCDIAVASADATFALPEVKRGIPCAATIPTLLRTIGRREAARLALTAATIDAHEAKRIELITTVVGRDEALSESLNLAQSIAQYDAVALELTKEVFRMSLDAPYGPSLRAARDIRIMARSLSKSEPTK